MIGNVALDVVISLVFIYLLYSLYATIIMEIVSSFFGLRARNLSYALRRMLQDEKKYAAVKVGSVDFSVGKYLAQLVNSFVQIGGWSINLKNKNLYEAFLKQPSIKYLGSGGFSNKPSYLTQENFCKGILDTIAIDDPDISELGRIQAGLRELPEDSETRIQLQSMLDDANNDLAKFKKSLERWFNDTMERSIGWFKRTTQLFLIVIGFVLVTVFNVDTITIVKKLSTDKDARDQLVALAINSQDEIEKTLTYIQNKPDSLKEVEDLNKRLDTLKRMRLTLEEDIKDSQNILAANWNLQSSLRIYKSRPKSQSDSSIVSHTLKNGDSIYLVVHHTIEPRILKKLLPDNISMESKKNSTITQAELKWLPINTGAYKRKYVLAHFWGYLLTVLALSLGAPFWFDLLNKLVKLRTSKSLPTTSDAKSGASGVTSPNTDNLNYVG